MKRFAASTALLAVAAAQAAPETYVIDSGSTSSQFSYRYLGVSEQTSRFERVSGTVVFDPVAKTGTADVTIDATSVNTGHAMLDRLIQAADFFDTGHFPTITFRSDRVVLDGPRPVLAGELTIRGQTRPVTLEVTRFHCEPDPALGADACSAQATGTIQRSDFDMARHRLLIGNDITLNLAIHAVRKSASHRLASHGRAR